MQVRNDKEIVILSGKRLYRRRAGNRSANRECFALGFEEVCHGKISCISPETASDDVKAIYKEIGRATGGWIPDFYQILANRPALLEEFWKMQGTLIFKGKVDRQHREMVNVFVSLKNGCEY